MHIWTFQSWFIPAVALQYPAMQSVCSFVSITNLTLWLYGIFVLWRFDNEDIFTGSLETLILINFKPATRSVRVQTKYTSITYISRCLPRPSLSLLTLICAWLPPESEKCFTLLCPFSKRYQQIITVLCTYYWLLCISIMYQSGLVIKALDYHTGLVISSAPSVHPAATM